MNKSLTPQAVASIFGFLVLAAAIAVSVYFQLVTAKVSPLPLVRGSFSLSIFNTELKPGGIFDKIKGLTSAQPVQQTPVSAVQYSPSDLGKDDIAQFN